MKKTIAALSIMALLLSLNIAYAKPDKDKEQNWPKGQPFTSVWTAINRLQRQLDAHTHSGGGTPGPIGPQGPQGPQGLRGISGAGNIAFIDSDLNTTSTVYALTTNGAVWNKSTSGWTNLNRNVATSTSAIVQWHFNSYLDQLGDIWRWNGTNWINVSHP